jgi:hypothetical protein
MNYKALLDTIDLKNRDISLVLITPKDTLFHWLDEFITLKGLQEYRLYALEENTVLVIPNVDRFTKPGSLHEFLDEMKPRLLLSELHRFQITGPEDFKRPITKETFDEFFRIELRTSASIVFIWDFK